MGNSKLYTGTDEHNGKEVTPQRKTTMFDLMNMNRHQRRAIGKKYGVKIPGINLAVKPKEPKEPKKNFMKSDAPVSSVMDVKA